MIGEYASMTKCQELFMGNICCSAQVAALHISKCGLPGNSVGLIAIGPSPSPAAALQVCLGR